MKLNSSHLPSHQAGFTLVEIMVGLVIGMLATAIILQVMSNFEAQKRVTTGTADAQTNGTIALYNIGRELQQAGFPLMPLKNSALECGAINFGTTGITSINPITITNGATSDTITVRYGDSRAGGASTPITGTTANALDATAADLILKDTNLGCQAGDITLIVNAATCALSSASDVPVAGSAGSAITRTLTLRDSSALAADATLACLGRWNEISYAVNNGNLVRTSTIFSNGTSVTKTDTVMEGIVNLQAQYGITDNSLTNNKIVEWKNADATWAAPTIADRNRIKAVRIAVVARNAKQETKDPATNTCVTTTACSAIDSANPTGLCAWEGTAASPAPAINLNADPDWGCYRYRVFENTIPLRNVIWSKGTLKP